MWAWKMDEMDTKTKRSNSYITLEYDSFRLLPSKNSVNADKLFACISFYANKYDSFRLHRAAALLGSHKRWECCCVIMLLLPLLQFIQTKELTSKTES